VIGFDRARLERLLRNGGNGKRPRLGLKAADAGGKDGVTGAIIGAVTYSSPAERAGLRAGDIIMELNRRRISGAAGLEQVLNGLTSGDKLTIVFLRDGATLKTEVTL
jgi:S1-C subfamily serine protease